MVDLVAFGITSEKGKLPDRIEYRVAYCPFLLKCILCIRPTLIVSMSSILEFVSGNDLNGVAMFDDMRNGKTAISYEAKAINISRDI